MMKFSTTCLALALPLSLIWACGSSGEDGGGTSTGGSGPILNGGSSVVAGGDSGGDSSNPSTGGSLNVGGTNTGGSLAAELCGDSCVCNNGIDDDMDGLLDGLDPECTGPLDNDEGSFATGIPGDNRDPKWQDCFFDGNSGAGDDDCRYHTDCITGDKEPDDPACTLTDACIKFCAPRTPNGCDCFGCCSVTLPSGDSIDILTGTNCSLDTAEDANACPRCTKSETCGNTCGECELCPGKTVEDLPESCIPDTGTGGAPSTGTGGEPGVPVYTCDDGEQVCGPDLPTCPLGRYCSLGCCLLTPPK